MRWILFLLSGLLLSLPFRAVAAEVRVCVYDNPPLSFTDASGATRGLLPDLLNEVARQKQWSLSYVSASWTECLEKLANGTVEILPAIGYTPQRAEKFRFAHEAILTNWGQIYQQPGGQFDSLPSLAERKVAVLKDDVHYIGGNGLVHLAETFNVNPSFVEVSSYLEAFSMLARGAVDVALVNRLFGLKHQHKFGLQATAIQLNPIQVRPAFSLHSPVSLTAAFDQQLIEWKQTPDSIFFQLMETWLKEKPINTFPAWLRYLMYLLSAVLITLIITTMWARRQVAAKTKQLEGKNRQLEDELLERQRVEDELRERHQQYQVLFEESQTIIILVDPATAKIVDASPAACSFYQYPREELQGMDVTRLNQLNESEIRTEMASVGNTGAKQFQFTHRLANGQLREVEVHCSPIVVAGRSLLCSIVHDISKRKQAERQLEERNQFLQSVIDGVSDPIMVIATDHRVIKMNRIAREQLMPGYAKQEEPRCYQVSHASESPCSGDEHPCPLEQVQENGESVTVIHHHVTSKGRRIIELNASPLFDQEGKIHAVIEVARDITDRLQTEELLSENEKRLHHLAHHDSLTDLPNRLLFEDRLKQALSKARRNSKQVALFFLDLDHFKDINDNLGHDFGDLLLIDIANRLRSCVRESDTVARMGGDEFLVLLDEVDSLELVEIMAERICASLIHELNQGKYYQRVSASIGISLYPNDGTSGQELLRNADLAMYRAKNQGKATYQYYSSPQTGFLF